ncbi:DUF3306 domain-containing protein [Aliivibrio logei]|uniref:DUF3306 domain-containing protein n=1 Tax=Aliivibrio logei TaxID=688 RepID=UPI0035C8D6A7
MSNFLSRWSLRKRKVQQGEPVSDEASVVIPEEHELISTQKLVDMQAEQEAVDLLEQEKKVTEERIDLPTEDDLISINGTSNVSQFMATGVDKNLKKAALRKMFLNPEFAMEDEPNYSTPPKLDSETAVKLRDWMVEPVEEEESELDPELLAEQEVDDVEISDTLNANDNKYQQVASDKEQESETKKTT